jgi:hypothetical protein
MQDVRICGVIIACKMCGHGATVQLNSIAPHSRSQARLTRDVTRQDGAVPLIVHNMSRAMGWGAPPHVAQAIICLLLAVEPELL